MNDSKNTDVNTLLQSNEHRSDSSSRTKMSSNSDAVVDASAEPKRHGSDESLTVSRPTIFPPLQKYGSHGSVESMNNVSPRTNVSPRMIKYDSMVNMSELPPETLEELTDTLQYVNPFVAKRHEEMQHPVYMREILPTGTPSSLELTLRQLQVHVNRIANHIDLDDRTQENTEAPTIQHRDPVRQSFTMRDLGRQSFADPHFMESFSGNVMRASEVILGRSNSITEAADASLGAIHLRIRDLRRLDFNLNPSEEPSFWVRKHAVLISIDPIRAVVMASRLIIIIPPGGMDNILEILERHLKDCLGNGEKKHTEIGGDQDGEGEQQDNHPFEVTAFEAILATVSSLHNQQFKALNEEAQEALTYFSSLSISKLNVILPFVVQEKLRMAKNELSALRSRIASLKVALNGLIEEEPPESMALMNLTKLGEDPSLYRLPLQPKLLAAHEEIEELLEAYLFDCNNQMTSIGNLLVKIRNAEQLMALKLDMGRNKILVTNMLLNVVSVLMVFGAYITAMFAMNLDNSVLFGGGAVGNNSVYGNLEWIWVGTMAVIIFGSFGLMWYYERAGIIPVTIHLNDLKQRTARNFKTLFTSRKQH